MTTPMTAAAMRARLGTLGLWRNPSYLDADLAAGLEQRGCRAVWVGGSPSGDLAVVDDLLAATAALTVATGVVNIWRDEAATVAASYHRIEQRHPGRFVLGIGAGHREQVGDTYERPYAAVQRYLDELDAAGVPADRLVLAALGPRMLRLARDRSAGAHPYLTTVEHTRRAREELGAGPLLAPELMVVLDTDAPRARDTGRARVARPYLELVNYTRSLRDHGFDDADFRDGGSDRLIDAVVAHGDAGAVAARVQEHLDAGADHVCIQILTPTPGADIREEFAAVATALNGPPGRAAG